MERKVKMMPPREHKPLDSRTIKLFKSLAQLREKQRDRDFQNWLKKRNDDDVPNFCFINWFMDEIKNVLHQYKYDITNEKRFKDEIATFIYKLSVH